MPLEHHQLRLLGRPEHQIDVEMEDVAFAQALKHWLPCYWVKYRTTFQSILNKLQVGREKVLKHLLRELEELVSKEIKLLDVSLADWHFVALEHSQGLVLKVKELRANIA